MAILCAWPEPRGAEGKGGWIWTDGGIGGMVCVVGMRGRQQGAGQLVCSCSIHGLEARAWTQRMGDDGGKGSRSQKKEDGVERDRGRNGGAGKLRNGLFVNETGMVRREGEDGVKGKEWKCQENNARNRSWWWWGLLSVQTNTEIPRRT